MLSRVRLRGINAHNALHPASYIASWYQFMLLGEQGVPVQGVPRAVDGPEFFGPARFHVRPGPAR
jgi:hypothetical protein